MERPFAPGRGPAPHEFVGPLANSSSNRIGSAVTLMSLGDMKELLHVSGDDQAGEMCTVSLALQELDSIRSATPARVTATIDFGSGGSLQRVYVSVRRGTQISLPASSIRVQVTLDRYIHDAAELPPVTVLGHVVRGPRASVSLGNAPVLEGPDGTCPAGASSTALALPPFANTITVVPGDASHFYDVAHVTLQDQLRATMVDYVASAWPGLRDLPLPAGAWRVVVSNPSAFDLTFTPIFGLAV